MKHLMVYVNVSFVANPFSTYFSLRISAVEESELSYEKL